jgi:hypothetical protein
VTDVPSKNCGRSEPQRALARTRSKSWPVPGSDTAFSPKLISLFPTKWGTLQLEGMVVVIRVMKALRAHRHALGRNFLGGFAAAKLRKFALGL